EHQSGITRPSRLLMLSRNRLCTGMRTRLLCGISGSRTELTRGPRVIGSARQSLTLFEMSRLSDTYQVGASLPIPFYIYANLLIRHLICEVASTGFLVAIAGLPGAEQRADVWGLVGPIELHQRTPLQSQDQTSDASARRGWPRRWPRAREAATLTSA